MYRTQDKTINLAYFDTINTPNKAYLLGFIAADGAIVKVSQTFNNYALTITIHRKDIEILELLKKELNSSLPIKTINTKTSYLPNGTDHVRFSTGQQRLVKTLMSYGIQPRKSLTMTDIISNIPKPFRSAFIIGYFDGDGCFVDCYQESNREYTRKRTGEVVTHLHRHWISCLAIKGSKEFLEGLGNELDVPFVVKQIKGQNIHTLKMTSNKSILKFYSLYDNCDFFLKRKKDKFTRKILQVRTISSSN